MKYLPFSSQRKTKKMKNDDSHSSFFYSSFSVSFGSAKAFISFSVRFGFAEALLYSTYNTSPFRYSPSGW